MPSATDNAASPAVSAPDPQANSRRRFLKLAGAGAGAAGLSAVIAACGGSDGGDDTTPTQTTKTPPAKTDNAGDLDVLNYALTLEYLEAGFYAAVIDAGVLKGAEAELAKNFGETEQAHVDAIAATITKLGGKPVAEPEAQFPLDSRATVLKTAAEVENLGAAAYLGQAGNITNPEVLAAALSIHSVEARHAAALNKLLGKAPTPDGAFAKPASKEQVLKAVQPFLTA